MLSTITNAGRAAMARAIAERPLHLAWGMGNPEWDTMQKEELPSLVDAEALHAEIGRRKPSVISFCVPDEAGGIVIPISENESAGTVEKARYSLSSTPTPYLYIRVDYDFEDASNSIIREIGLFLDTKPLASCPAGQFYFRPNELAETGMMFCAQILNRPIHRTISMRQSVEFVQPI